jgi:hypothetical protein
MYPSIKPNQSIIIQKKDNYDIEDIVAYKKDGKIIVHRIIDKKDNEIITKINRSLIRKNNLMKI